MKKIDNSAMRKLVGGSKWKCPYCGFDCGTQKKWGNHMAHCLAGLHPYNI